jgi:hypothetical protein
LRTYNGHARIHFGAEALYGLIERAIGVPDRSIAGDLRTDKICLVQQRGFYLTEGIRFKAGFEKICGKAERKKDDKNIGER